ncbi:MAG: chaperone NapD [Colwellia sp.]
MTDNSKNITSEYHVASLIAYCILTEVEKVKLAITNIERTEIHAINEQGKIVFTIEGTSHKDIGKKMDIIRVHSGILNLSPVYHQVLDESADNDAIE